MRSDGDQEASGAVSMAVQEKLFFSEEFVEAEEPRWKLTDSRFSLVAQLLLLVTFTGTRQTGY